VYVAVASGASNACLLPDVYHLYKGGSKFEGLALLGPEALHVFHMNDYPAEPPVATITDADRVYPGDGVAPLDYVLGALRSIGFNGMLSLELFNKSYWQQDARLVARTGLEKMRSAVAKVSG
jgi:sugar phosphate isomerase/epimerase